MQDLLGITNGADALSLDGDCEDDDITEPIAPCTSLTPTQVRVVRLCAQVCYTSVFTNSTYLGLRLSYFGQQCIVYQSFDHGYFIEVFIGLIPD